MRVLKKALAAAIISTGVFGANAASADDIRIVSQGLGSSWYVFGATLAQLIEPEIDGAVDVIPRGGGVGNPITVNNGEADIGLSNAATANWAMHGHEDVYQDRTFPNIRALVGGLNTVYVTAMVSEDYIERTGRETLGDILTADSDGPRIIMKPAGSSVPVVADMIMAAYGVDRDAIEASGGSITQVSAQQLPSLMSDGRADIYFEVAIPGHPAVTETTLTSDVRFMDLSPEAQAILAEQGLRPAPFGPWFEGQDGETQAVDMGTVLIANSDLSEELAYIITRALVENKDAMAQAHAAWQNFEPEQSWRPENTGIELHPGAIRYYQERGWM